MRFGKRNNVLTPGKVTWRKFQGNKPAMAGVLYISLMVLISVLGPFIRPDHSVHANQQQLSLSKQKPGFSVQVLSVARNGYNASGLLDKIFHYGWESPDQEYPFTEITFEEEGVAIVPFQQGEATGQLKRFSYEDILMDLDRSAGFTTSTSSLQELVKENRVYQRTYLLGTDKYGRDFLSRLLAGTIISLSVGVIAVLISLIIGLVLGALAGYFGGRTDDVIMWLINVVWSIPTLLLVMAITLAFGKGFWKVFLAVGLTMWVEVARIVRGQVLSIRNKEYIEAGRALAYSHSRLIFKHVLPNTLSPVIVISAANFAAAILIEAGLSFLGIGAQIPTPSWGNMIKEHYAYITTDLAYLAIIPGIMIMLLVLAFMLVGNGLRDALDVRNQ